MNKIKWKVCTDRYCSGGENGYLGKYKLFYISWNVHRDEKTWNINTVLPGFKTGIGIYDSKEECRNKAEVALSFWLSKTGLRIALRRRKV